MAAFGHKNIRSMIRMHDNRSFILQQEDCVCFEYTTKDTKTFQHVLQYYSRIAGLDVRSVRQQHDMCTRSEKVVSVLNTRRNICTKNHQFECLLYEVSERRSVSISYMYDNSSVALQQEKSVRY